MMEQHCGGGGSVKLSLQVKLERNIKSNNEETVQTN